MTSTKRREMTTGGQAPAPVASSQVPEAAGAARATPKVPAPIARPLRLPKALDVETTWSGLRAQLALLAAALESLPEGILVLELTGRELFYNRKLAEMLRIPARGSADSALNHMATLAREPGSFLARMQAMSSRPETDGHSILELKDGRVVELRSSSHRVDNISVGSVFTFRDVTNAKRAEANLRHYAFHDPLTGLPNRALLLDRIGQAIEQAQRHRKQLALLFIDLDRFKHVNDAHGHPAGDRLLLEAGRRLVGCVRREDTVARLGGDEFVALLHEVTEGGDAAGVAVKVLRALARPFIVAERQMVTDASIGISLFPGDGSDAETLLSRADHAMYLAKKSGGASYRNFQSATNF